MTINFDINSDIISSNGIITNIYQKNLKLNNITCECQTYYYTYNGIINTINMQSFYDLYLHKT